MSVRSLLTVGLLATAALAVPAANAKTTTVTSTKTKTKTVTDTLIEKTTKTVKTTITDVVTKTKTKSTTVTAAGTTVTDVSSITVTASASACPTITSAPSGSSTAKGSSSVSGTSVPSSSVTSQGSSVTSSSTGTNTNPTTTLKATHTGTMGLNDYAKATGKLYLGTAADIPDDTTEFTDKYYEAAINNTHNFGQRTPANVMKWEYIEPEQNVFNFTQGDEFIALAKANDQIVRCHNLNWYNQNPNWLTDGTWTNATILAALVNHINKTVAHFGDGCYAWDVVNEALNDDGTYREDIWYNITGTSYIPTAFAAAEAAVKENGLSVKLYYNDYNIEYPGVKSTAAQAIVSDLKSRGVQIDGVGLQSHFIVGETPSEASQVQNMEAFTALGVDVAVTELDVRTTVPPTLGAEQQQVLDFASTVGACTTVKGCVGVTLWDFDDTYSWIPSTFAGQGYGDPWFQPAGAGTPLVEKAAYDGIIDGFTGVVPVLGASKKLRLH